MKADVSFAPVSEIKGVYSIRNCKIGFVVFPFVGACNRNFSNRLSIPGCQEFDHSASQAPGGYGHLFYAVAGEIFKAGGRAIPQVGYEPLCFRTVASILGDFGEAAVHPFSGESSEGGLIPAV